MLCVCPLSHCCSCATGVTLSFEGTDVSSSAFATAGQVKKLNSFSLLSLYFVAKQSFFNVVREAYQATACMNGSTVGVSCLVLASGWAVLCTLQQTRGCCACCCAVCVPCRKTCLWTRLGNTGVNLVLCRVIYSKHTAAMQQPMWMLRLKA